MHYHVTTINDFHENVVDFHTLNEAIHFVANKLAFYGEIVTESEQVDKRRAIRGICRSMGLITECGKSLTIDLASDTSIEISTCNTQECQIIFDLYELGFL